MGFREGGRVRRPTTTAVRAPSAPEDESGVRWPATGQPPARSPMSFALATARGPDSPSTTTDRHLARPGRDLGNLREPMEALLNFDFAAVRVHHHGLADVHRAQAVTIGDDIHLSSAAQDLSSPGGRMLLAHELSHVIQQRHLPAGQVRGTSDLEREADAASTAVAAGRHASVSGKAAAAGPVRQRKPKLAPLPPSGNILYVGMNNADPEVKALHERYRSGSSPSVTVVKGTTEEAATSIGGTATFDLTTDAGMDALTKALTADPAKQAALLAILKPLSGGDRDDLAHVAKVYADTEADGKDRMTRVVLSGHSGGLGVFGSSGEVYFDALVQLAAVFPAAANQTKHLMVAGCHTGDERTILDYYVKAYPSLLTVWAWWDVCPTGPGAAAAVAKWAALTEHGEKTLPKQGGGIATWSGGVYEGSPSAKANLATLLASIRADDAHFQEYFDGTRADRGPHGGWLEAYYGRVFAAARRADVTGADRDEMEQKRQRALLLRFWSETVTKNFWARYGATITKGYGSAAVPDYANLSRKDALAAIAAFDASSTAAAADKSAAATLLQGLRTLDPKIIPDSMVAERP